MEQMEELDVVAAYSYDNDIMAASLEKALGMQDMPPQDEASAPQKELLAK